MKKIRKNTLRILVIGSGAREHALAWKIFQSPLCKRIFCAPGNAGTAEVATNVDIKATDIQTLIAFAKAEDIDLVVVGPEGPLAAGIVDDFRKAGFLCFGPTQKAAQLESSKSFAKGVMTEARISTPSFCVFTDYEKAADYVRRVKEPFVVKVDCLAEGKGVEVCDTVDETLEAIHRALVENQFGEAGRKVLIETRQKGFEYSSLSVCGEESAFLFPPFMDHKRLEDGDRGPNTGGMGAVGPLPFLAGFIPNPDRAMLYNFILPALVQMKKRGFPFTGCLYAGMMMTAAGPTVLEYNNRFGDPETSAAMMQIEPESDLLPLLIASSEGDVIGVELKFRPGATACVVMASKGYPGKYETGKPILIDPSLFKMPNVKIFHSGTRRVSNQLVSAGGRVLQVTAYADSLTAAVEKAYEAVELISFEGCHFRRDIGQRALDLARKSNYP